MAYTRRSFLAVMLVVAAVLVVGAAPVIADDKPASSSESLAIANGSSVDIEYTLTDEAGQVIDSNKGDKPLTYTQGKKQLLSGLEKELDGMHAGEEKKVKVTPENGYGYPDPRAVMEVAKETMPEGALEVGTQLIGRGPKGEVRPVTVKEIKEKTVVLDLNHPLAGKTLFFAIKVLGVTPVNADAPKADAPAAESTPAQQ